MNEEVHSAIENVAPRARNTSGRKTAQKAPSAPTSAPPAESKSTAKRKAALNGDAGVKPAPASKVTVQPAAAPKVRKGPAPLLFRGGKNPLTFADAIAESRKSLADAKATYKQQCLDLSAADKDEKQARGELRAAYKLLGAAVGDTLATDDGNKAEIAAAQTTVKAAKATYAEKGKVADAASKAADKAEAAVKKAQAELNARVDAKATAQAAAKGA